MMRVRLNQYNSTQIYNSVLCTTWYFMSICGCNVLSCSVCALHVQQVYCEAPVKTTHIRTPCTLIYMIYVLHLRSRPPPPPSTYVTVNPITSHSPTSSSHTRFLSWSRHSQHSTKRDLSCTLHAHIGQRQSTHRFLCCVQDYAADMKMVVALWTGLNLTTNSNWSHCKPCENCYTWGENIPGRRSPTVSWNG